MLAGPQSGFRVRRIRADRAWSAVTGVRTAGGQPARFAHEGRARGPFQVRCGWPGATRHGGARALSKACPMSLNLGSADLRQDSEATGHRALGLKAKVGARMPLKRGFGSALQSSAPAVGGRD
jgi:hypothetical protein